MNTKLNIVNWLCAIILIASFSSVSIHAQEESTSGSNTPFEIKEIEAVKGIVIKADVPVAEIGTKMGEIYGQLFAYLQSNNIEAVGPPFSVYYSFDPQGNSVFEAGIPVADKAESTGNIKYKEFEAVKALSTTYIGSFENMMGIYAEMFEYMKKENLESTGISWEIYLTDPEKMKDPNANKIQIYFPLK